MVPNVFRIKRILKVPQTVMLGVVGDVAKYHEFVPYCTESVVTKQIDNVPSEATLTVGWNGLYDSFKSDLKYTKDSVVASASTDSTLFEKLACTWTIKPVTAEKCHANLDLEFKFANSFYDKVAGSAGSLVAEKMVKAFSERAEHLQDAKTVG